MCSEIFFFKTPALLKKIFTIPSYVVLIGVRVKYRGLNDWF